MLCEIHATILLSFVYAGLLFPSVAIELTGAKMIILMENWQAQAANAANPATLLSRSVH